MRVLLLLLLGGAVALACGSDDAGGGGSGGSGAGGGDGGAGAEGGGGSSACETLDDCPVLDDACGVWTACEEGACVGDLQPDGTPVEMRGALGDCQREVCDGAGRIDGLADDDDLPNDYNPCTSDACDDGAPTFLPDNEGMQCGSNIDTICQAGKCVGCKNGEQCPQGDSCMLAVCEKEAGMTEGTCGFEIDVGKEVANVDESDCLHAVCDESGQIIVLGNTEEIPRQDVNDCDAEVCTVQGTAIHQALEDGAACGDSTFCNPSACDSAICVKQMNPESGTLTPGQTDGDCVDIVCDGQGNTTTVPLPLGTPCIGGVMGICNGSGGCA